MGATPILIIGPMPTRDGRPFAVGFTLRSVSPNLCPQFLAHSVVEKPDGSVVEITAQGFRPYPIIRHQGAADDFDRLIDECSLVRLNYRQGFVDPVPLAPACPDFGVGIPDVNP